MGISMEAQKEAILEKSKKTMSVPEMGIQIWEQAVTEFDSGSDIFCAVAVHPRFCNRVVNIRGMDRETRLENTILDPSD